MKTLHTVATNMFYELENEGAPNFLRNHPGNGGDIIQSASWRMAKHPQMTKLSADQFEEIQAIVSSKYEEAQALCESPIERDMLAALMSGNWDRLLSPFVPVHSVRDKQESIKASPVVIIPQFPLGRFRLDFAILIRGKGRARILAVECDGKEFHDDWTDKQRDTYLDAFGVSVFRAPGKSLVANPYDIADLVIQAVQLHV